MNMNMKLNRFKQKDLTKIIGLICFVYFLAILVILGTIVYCFEEENELNAVHYQNVSNSDSECYFESDYCFNFYRCISFVKKSNKSFLRVHVYSPTRADHKLSDEFREFIQTILESDFYESDPRKACIFVPLIDLTNEYKLVDKYSIQQQLHSLK